MKKYLAQIGLGSYLLLGCGIVFATTTAIAYSRLKNTELYITELQTHIASTTTQIESLSFEKTELIEKLTQKEQEVTDLEKKYKKADKKADELEKIIETDKELLQKYSKVYFLNEHYTPSKLAQIDTSYLSDSSREFQIHKEVLPYLEDMIDDAVENDNITIRVASAYRSFDTQKSLKSSYTVTYGAGTANQFSADQGYSEHQLGTTVDLTTPGSSLTIAFEKTEAFEWLTKNAYKYGFVLSYPKNNSYYQYEPWHWRFVGKDLARKLHKQDKYFYDLDQRDINEYLGEIFD